jgi:hypothetical protein
VEGGEADGWATAIASGSEEIIEQIQMKLGPMASAYQSPANKSRGQHIN